MPEDNQHTHNCGCGSDCNSKCKPGCGADCKHPHDQPTEDVYEISDDLPDGCSADFECAAHPDGSICGDHCGHKAVRHGDHVDYLVPDGEGGYELHHPHGDHCDYHGTVKKAKPPCPCP